ncbi:cbb3-type cytochrome oxidase assembly protein CcoS [Chryseobacterium sp. cx-311]|uniref:cbb3-type cytochrome oxidase assembly protein CcoS n=1 Tax=Marnyiella aurantia TaxID=2758037 RepID=UPI001AE59C36|nr:cbb3-type cytochrome oxidase assembly protein CcoS [Marnyiella aurantia]MBP0612031.1 cbb3-type cytochrome oxidase assembly protein CcoS [Marnyiella aurantia]
MDILYLMIICSVSVGVVFLLIFIYNARNGQFEDDESPAVRILLDRDNPVERESETEKTESNTQEKSD